MGYDEPGMNRHYSELAALPAADLDEALRELDRTGAEIMPDIPRSGPDEPVYSGSGEPADEAFEIYFSADEAVEVYFREVAMVPRLTADEELQLAAEDARKRLMESSLFRVIPIARHYRRPGSHLLDCQQGNLGLMQAATNFDPARGYKFPNYAAFHIHRALLDFLSNPPKPIIPPHRQ
jgi:DNA-directed RNA polymerase sigma subunit (sigma70/sigma32)